jgi:predicted nucleic acid-binding protein
MIVLDTNVLAELMKRGPAEAVIVWMAAQPVTSLFTTTITEAETLYGLALLPAGRRRSALTAAANAMFEVDFAGRILGFDSAAAREFADIAATRRHVGRPIAQADAQIAAIVRSRGAALATRNSADFTQCGISVVNPWEA